MSDYDNDELLLEIAELNVYRKKVEIFFLKKFIQKILNKTLDDCCICRSEIKDDVCILLCNHVMHNDCAIPLRACPLCRAEAIRIVKPD